MVKLIQGITFILNDETVTTDVSPSLLVLDYLRQEKRLVGTKSGCKEGDCGACSVILGELDNDGLVSYRPMTSCLLPMGELNGKHLVSIEGLNMKKLSPVQSAMVDCGGTQCGYCTPGFVVCMTAGLMAPQIPLNKEGVLYAISGNLCRCTGYRSIKEAGMQSIDKLRDHLIDKERIAALVDAGALPDYFSEIPSRLKTLRADVSAEAESPNPRYVIAGGTDLYVQRGELIPDESVVLLNNRAKIPAAQIREDRLIVDARMTFETFGLDPLVQSYLGDIEAYNLLIASWPIRTRSTLGGNLCNGSPIADMTCLLLALETSIHLVDRAGSKRDLPLKDFYLGYKQLNKADDEIAFEISFPVFGESTFVNWEKVSKRAWLDIATVNSACKLTVESGEIVDAHLSLGGVAATPLYLEATSRFLRGQTLCSGVLSEALNIAQTEFEPISDVRGSARYKRLLARQLMAAHFAKLFPDTFSEEVLYATL